MSNFIKVQEITVLNEEGNHRAYFSQPQIKLEDNYSRTNLDKNITVYDSDETESKYYHFEVVSFSHFAGGITVWNVYWDFKKDFFRLYIRH